MATIKKGFVTDGNGNYLVQLPSNSQWGFCLASDDQSWEGGLGSGFKSFELVPEDQVPVEDRERLGWLLDQD